MRRPYTLVLVAALAAAAWPSRASGPSEGDRGPVIDRADADAAKAHLFIHGRNFGRHGPTVTLGNLPLEVESASPTDVVAKLPSPLPDASYRLVLTTGGRREERSFQGGGGRDAWGEAVFEVTIGAGQPGPVGPTGPTGPAGAQGPKGDRGDPGTGTVDARFGTGTNWAAEGRGRECTIGEIILTAGSVANGTPANGQLLPIQNYQALFALMGTTYGGNGTTNFALPDLRGAAPNGLSYSICVNGIFPSRN